MENDNQVQQKSNGALVGSVVVIIILIIGGIFLFKAKLDKMRQSQNIAGQQATDNSANGISNSADITNIQNDLNNNGNINSLDKDLQ